MVTKRMLCVWMLVLAAAGLAGATGSQEAAKPKGPVELVWWHREGAAAQEWHKIVADEYMKANPHVTVKLEVQPANWAEFGAKLRLALRSGGGPDIFSTHDIDQQPFVAAGFTAPAPPNLVARVDKYAVGETFKLMAHGGDLKAPVHMVSWFTHWPQMFYNADMVREAGLPARPAQTWDEFRQMAKKLTQYDASGAITRSGFNFVLADPAWLMSPWYYSAGGSMLTPDNKAAAVNGEAGKRAFQLIYDLYHTDRVSRLDADVPEPEFKNKKTAMYALGMHSNAWLATNAPEVAYFMGNIPKDKFSATPLAVRPISVNKNGDVAEAWKFVEFVLRPENLSKLLDPKKFSMLPPYTDVLEALVAQGAYKGLDWVKVGQAQPNLRARMAGLGASDAYTQFGRTVSEVMAKKVSVADGLKDLEDKINGIMKDRPIIEFQIEMK